jgi:polyhydroxyalkanoic acid synthase PhaR subunit
VSDGINHQTSMDPMELWRQWNETTSKMWSTVLERGKEAPVDPYGLYQLWLKNTAEAQEQLKADLLSMMNPLEIWKQWFDATTEVWSKSAEMSNDSLALSTQWLKIVEETRDKILSGEIRSADPFTFLKQWYDATSETWSQVVGEVISSERFMEANRKFIETYTSAVRMSHRVNEEALKNLQIPTRSDIARVAELVVSLEEKVDTIEDVLEDFESSYAKMATSEAVESLGGRLEQVESKLSTLDILPTALEKIEALGGLEGRLEQVESKLSTLDTLPTALEKIEALEGLEGHLDRVENKLDTLLLAFREDW